MAVYERDTLLDVPLERVWAFHVRVDGLLALTPNWIRMECHGVAGPGGESVGRELVEGAEVELSVQPFGVGPRRSWRSLIETRRRDPSAGVFRDRMVDGPFDRWVHTHSFHDTGQGTRVRDHVAYDLGDGTLSGLASRLAVVGLAPTFRHRHRRLRTLLESGDWDGWE